VPFHVEIRRSLRHARVFNLDAQELRARVLAPWSRGVVVELGEQEWDPSESVLTVIEGPSLPGHELGHGQGWYHAQRSGREVTAQVLREAQPAVRIAARAAPPSAGLATAALSLLEAEPVAWDDVRARLLAGGRAPEEVTAVVLLVDGHEPASAWLLDAGLAIGAFGARAIVACAGSAPPDAPGVTVLALGDDDPARALAERVRVALAATRR
jgi:hypothetical protein